VPDLLLLAVPVNLASLTAKLLTEGLLNEDDAADRTKIAEAAGVYLRRPSGPRVLRDKTRLAPAPVMSFPVSRGEELEILELYVSKAPPEVMKEREEKKARHAQRLEQGGSSFGQGSAPDEDKPLSYIRKDGDALAALRALTIIVGDRIEGCRRTGHGASGGAAGPATSIKRNARVIMPLLSE
jgi:hypothetical protein